jgi:hypothetical protein
VSLERFSEAAEILRQSTDEVSRLVDRPARI